MTHQDILAIRLSNEQLTRTALKTPDELVKWFGAVQSQDYPGAKWALGQRLGLLDTQIEQSFNEGKILRTHVMRPTWHFVHPEDLVWMQKLTAPRVQRIMDYYNKILGLNQEILSKTSKIIEKALKGKNYFTRLEIKKTLEENGISASTQKLGHIVSQAELDAVICSGPRKGKQFTYALVSEQTESYKQLTPKNSLEELARRYFTSHGPATVKDFVWWSGLLTADARIGIEAAKLKSEIVEGKEYWFSSSQTTNYSLPSALYFLPNYDEYTIAYQDREAFVPSNAKEYFMNQGNAAFWNAIVYKGVIIGMWKKIMGKKSLNIQTQIFKPLTADQKKALDVAIEKYSKFLGLPVVVSN